MSTQNGFRGGIRRRPLNDMHQNGAIPRPPSPVRPARPLPQPTVPNRHPNGMNVRQVRLLPPEPNSNGVPNTHRLTIPAIARNGRLVPSINAPLRHPARQIVPIPQPRIPQLQQVTSPVSGPGDESSHSSPRVIALPASSMPQANGSAQNGQQGPNWRGNRNPQLVTIVPVFDQQRQTSTDQQSSQQHHCLVQQPSEQQSEVSHVNGHAGCNGNGSNASSDSRQDETKSESDDEGPPVLEEMPVLEREEYEVAPAPASSRPPSLGAYAQSEEVMKNFSEYYRVNALPYKVLACILCQKMPTAPYITSCRHRFCKACVLPRWIGDNKVCPECNEMMRRPPRPDPVFDQILSNLNAERDVVFDFDGCEQFDERERKTHAPAVPVKRIKLKHRTSGDMDPVRNALVMKMLGMSYNADLLPDDETDPKTLLARLPFVRGPLKPETNINDVTSEEETEERLKTERPKEEDEEDFRLGCRYKSFPCNSGHSWPEVVRPPQIVSRELIKERARQLQEDCKRRKTFITGKETRKVLRSEMLKLNEEHQHITTHDASTWSSEMTSSGIMGGFSQAPNGIATILLQTGPQGHQNILFTTDLAPHDIKSFHLFKDRRSRLMRRIARSPTQKWDQLPINLIRDPTVVSGLKSTLLNKIVALASHNCTVGHLIDYFKDMIRTSLRVPALFVDERYAVDIYPVVTMCPTSKVALMKDEVPSPSPLAVAPERSGYVTPRSARRTAGRPVSSPMKPNSKQETTPKKNTKGSQRKVATEIKFEDGDDSLGGSPHPSGRESTPLRLSARRKVAPRRLSPSPRRKINRDLSAALTLARRNSSTSLDERECLGSMEFSGRRTTENSDTDMQQDMTQTGGDLKDINSILATKLKKVPPTAKQLKLPSQSLAIITRRPLIALPHDKSVLAMRLERALQPWDAITYLVTVRNKLNS